jgi:hypothetical protein
MQASKKPFPSTRGMLDLQQATKHARKTSPSMLSVDPNMVFGTTDIKMDPRDHSNILFHTLVPTPIDGSATMGERHMVPRIFFSLGKNTGRQRKIRFSEIPKIPVNTDQNWSNEVSYWYVIYKNS